VIWVILCGLACGLVHEVPYVPDCGGVNCTGCCLPDGGCVPGLSISECGWSGEACAPCPAGQRCVQDRPSMPGGFCSR